MMKLTIFTVCFLISTMHYSVQGGLVKDFFGKVKETADVVHKDVKQIWRPESDTTNKDKGHGDQTVTTPVAPNAAKDDAPGKKEDSKVSEMIPDVNQNTPDGSTTTTSTTVATEVKENKLEETTTVSYKKEDSKVSEMIPDVNQNTPDGSTTTTSTTVATEIKENKLEETTTVSYSTTTKKEDRAVLSGGCQAGYKRTDNGRCMPTY